MGDIFIKWSGCAESEHLSQPSLLPFPSPQHFLYFLFLVYCDVCCDILGQIFALLEAL